METLVEINLKDLKPDITSILYNAINQEEIDRGVVSLELVDDGIKIIINGETFTKARAILNSYILWLYTILQSLEEVERK